jgi:hypothetical protein
VLTGSLRDDEVHRHIVVGSSSLGHWHTGVGGRQGKQRNQDVHAAVAAAQIAHTESGIVHAPPPEEPDQRRGSLYEIVEKRLAEARARGATPVHPSRVNESPVRRRSNPLAFLATSSRVTHSCFNLRMLYHAELCRTCARYLARESHLMQSPYRVSRRQWRAQLTMTKALPLTRLLARRHADGGPARWHRAKLLRKRKPKSPTCNCSARVASCTLQCSSACNEQRYDE